MDAAHLTRASKVLSCREGIVRPSPSGAVVWGNQVGKAFLVSVVKPIS